MKKAIAKSKATPQIFVLGLNERGYFGGARYCKAHLRNKKGYVYLQWKDAGKVCSFYLGKAPRSSPTRSDQLQLARRRAIATSGRARIHSKVRQATRRRGRVSRG